MLVVFNVIVEHLQSIHLGGVGVANGSPALAMVLVYVLCASGCVFRLDHLQFFVRREVISALHKCHRMRVDLAYRAPVVVWQAAYAMRDVQLVFTDDGRVAVAQKLIVVKQRAGYGIFYCRHADDGGVLFYAVEHLLKGVAAYQLYLLTLEVFVCGYVVKRP